MLGAGASAGHAIYDRFVGDLYGQRAVDVDAAFSMASAWGYGAGHAVKDVALLQSGSARRSAMMPIIHPSPAPGRLGPRILGLASGRERFSSGWAAREMVIQKHRCRSVFVLSVNKSIFTSHLLLRKPRVVISISLLQGS